MVHGGFWGPRHCGACVCLWVCVCSDVWHASVHVVHVSVVCADVVCVMWAPWGACGMRRVSGWGVPVSGVWVSVTCGGLCAPARAQGRLRGPPGWAVGGGAEAPCAATESPVPTSSRGRRAGRAQVGGQPSSFPPRPKAPGTWRATRSPSLPAGPRAPSREKSLAQTHVTAVTLLLFPLGGRQLPASGSSPLREGTVAPSSRLSSPGLAAVTGQRASPTAGREALLSTRHLCCVFPARRRTLASPPAWPGPQGAQGAAFRWQRQVA